jgi:hypothetical protein
METEDRSKLADLIFNTSTNLLELEYCYDEEELNEPSDKCDDMHNMSLLTSEEFVDVNLLSKIGGRDDDGDFYIEMDNDLLFKLNSSTRKLKVSCILIEIKR